MGRARRPVFEHFCFSCRPTLDRTSTGHKEPLGHDTISFPVSVLVLLPGHLLLFPPPPIPTPPSSAYLTAQALAGSLYDILFVESWGELCHII